MELKLLIWLVLSETAHSSEFFLMKNEFDVNRRVSDDTFEMVRENYSRVVSSALKHDVAISSGCGGIFKSRQHLIQSPNYPQPYAGDLDCAYTLISPFVCKNQFNIQFIDFDVEPSMNCSKDFLQIGDDEILCGQVIGIKR